MADIFSQILFLHTWKKWSVDNRNTSIALGIPRRTIKLLFLLLGSMYPMGTLLSDALWAASQCVHCWLHLLSLCMYALCIEHVCRVSICMYAYQPRSYSLFLSSSPSVARHLPLWTHPKNALLSADVIWSRSVTGFFRVEGGDRQFF